MLSWVQNINITMVLQGFYINVFYVNLGHLDRFQTLDMTNAENIHKYNET